MTRGRHADRSNDGRHRRIAAWVPAAVLGLGGLATIATGFALEATPSAPPASTVTGAIPPPVPTPTSPAPASEPATVDPPPPALAPAHPTSIRIPAIGVEAPIAPLGLNPDRSVEVPTDFSHTGWYRHGPTPGEIGPAVILGHVDSYRGPAVFYRLDQLHPGDTVRIARVGGSTATFRIDALRQYSKDAFPTDRVYGHTDHAALRLITCGGDFNPITRSYEDNIVVYAHLDPSS